MAEREEVSLSVRNEEDVSPECLAWADSCIISFPEDSDNANWVTFRDALTEIIDIHPEMFVPSSSRGRDVVMTESESVNTRIFVPEANSSTEEVSEIISMLRFETDPSKNSLQDQYFSESTAENGTTSGSLDNASKDVEGENGEEEEEEAELLPSQVFKDEFMNASIQDNVDEFNVLEDPVNVTTTPQEIFKVWDLEIVGDEDDDGEDGLVLQLQKALLDQPRSLNDDQQVVTEMGSIDDLIAGISDMSIGDISKPARPDQRLNRDN